MFTGVYTTSNNVNIILSVYVKPFHLQFSECNYSIIACGLLISLRDSAVFQNSNIFVIYIWYTCIFARLLSKAIIYTVFLPRPVYTRRSINIITIKIPVIQLLNSWKTSIRWVRASTSEDWIPSKLSSIESIARPIFRTNLWSRGKFSQNHVIIFFLFEIWVLSVQLHWIVTLFRIRVSGWKFRQSLTLVQRLFSFYILTINTSKSNVFLFIDIF